MTWPKTGTEFPGDCAAVDLSDAAYRTHHEVICWLYAREDYTCRIRKDRVLRVAETEDIARAIRELCDVGFWSEDGGYYQVIHQGDVIRQSLYAQQLRRARNKRGAAAYRKRQKAQNVSADVIADVIDTTDRQTGTRYVRAEKETRRAKTSPSTQETKPARPHPRTSVPSDGEEP